jgi:uncharacterized protein
MPGMTRNSKPEPFACGLLRKPTAAVLLAVTLVFCAAGSTPVLAQADPFAWFEQLFRPPQQSHVARPRPDFRRAGPEVRQRPRYPSAERAYRRSPSRPAESKTAKSPEKPAVPPTFFVAVLGDSLGQMLAQGLGEAFENRPEVAILHKAKESSGLVRDDFYDWIKATQDLLASGEKIDYAVMMIGSNDQQTLRDANGSYEPGSPEWQTAYTQRIEAIASLFREKKIPLIWVGLPILKSERLSAAALNFNQFYRAYAEKAGATYVDIWEAFADEAGHYSVSGPDINGQTVHLRAADGVHFTKAGARKLAHFVEPEIRRKLDEMQPKVEPDMTPAVAPNPETAPNEGAAAPSNVSALPGAEAAPPPKPIAGPVLPLTAPVLAAGGQLATRATSSGAANTEARKLIDQTLQQGQPVAPKPGRADDFSWPRP